MPGYDGLAGLCCYATEYVYTPGRVIIIMKLLKIGAQQLLLNAKYAILLTCERSIHRAIRKPIIKKAKNKYCQSTGHFCVFAIYTIEPGLAGFWGASEEKGFSFDNWLFSIGN